MCAFDDKRILLDDEITTLAYGHYKVAGEVKEIFGEEPLLQSSQSLAPFFDCDEDEEIPSGIDPQKLAFDYLLQIIEGNQQIDEMQEIDEDEDL